MPPRAARNVNPINRRYPKAHRTIKRGLGVNKTYTFRQVVSVGKIQNYTIATGGSLEFKLDFLPQVNTFKALFDQYKIDSVHLKFMPRATPTQTTGLALPNDTSMVWYSHVDVDDSNLPTSVNQMLECDNVRILSANGNVISQKIKPHVASALFGGGVFASYGSQKNQWIDCASSDAAHYGFKYMFPAAFVQSSICYDVYATYIVSFKGVR